MYYSMNVDSKHLLLVEDEKLVAFAEADLLQRGGYKVTVARNAEDAIELARSISDLCLILMDIDLGGGMEGTEAAGRILEFRDIPVVFLSSHVETHIVNKTREITRYGYVLKNSGDAILFASIDMALRLHESRIKLRQELTAKTEIANASAAFVAIDSLKGVYTYLGEKLKEISGATYLFISVFDEILENVRMESVFGIDSVLQKVFELFTFDSERYAVSLSSMSPEEIGQFTSKRLVEYSGGFYGLSGKTVPKALCQAAEQFLGITSIYTIGFSWEGRLYGGVTMMFTREGAPRNRDLIEILINQAAVAVRRIHAEERLKSYKRDFEVVVERSPDIISRMDKNHRYMYTSPAAFRYTNIKPEDFIGKTNKELGFPDTLCKLWSGALDKVFHKKKELSLEFVFPGPEGEHQFQSCLVPEFDRDGKVQFVLVINRDITDHSRAMHLLKDTLQENEILYKELQHRMRNTLSMISGFLSRDMELLPDKAGRDAFLAAQEKVSGLIGFYEKLSLKDSAEHVDISVFFDDLFGSFLSSYLRPDSPIKLNVSCEAFTLDKKRAVILGIVVNELVTNALRHAFSEMSGTVSITVEKKGDTVAVSVRDDGKGFKPGKRGDDSMLGLSLVRLFSERLSGRFSITSENGTTASFSFPL